MTSRDRNKNSASVHTEIAHIMFATVGHTIRRLLARRTRHEKMNLTAYHGMDIGR